MIFFIDHELIHESTMVITNKQIEHDKMCTATV